jgi:hypothetical protein
VGYTHRQTEFPEYRPDPPAPAGLVKNVLNGNELLCSIALVLNWLIPDGNGKETT